jgi:hypothetical protein
VEGNVSLAGGAADRINNVENVFLKEPRPGVWRVLVAAHRLAWDQRGARGGWSQDFGLVACGVEARPILPADWAE